MSETRARTPPRDAGYRRAHAERLAFLIDGEAYFGALREAVCGARRRLLIVGWDIDTRLRLVRGRPPDGRPERLGELLYYLLKQNRNLHIHVLIWDWAMLYAAERQWLPLYNLRWRRHRRLHFRLDDRCPFGASQHQKLVVIDDNLAFIGGFDLSRDRWDTPDHSPDDERRTNPDAQPYRPFHDLQALVSGPAAAALGALARERWQRVTGQYLPACPPEPPTAWPAHVEPEVCDIEVGIARTAPAYEGEPAIREIETLLLAAIDTCRQYLYIENEYLTSERIGKALENSLQRDAGPELVVVLPKKTGNWLEQNTMDVLRWRLLCRLREADRHARLYVCYPEREGLGDSYISLHSKLLIADDSFLTLGSANLSNRSMGFDTECNLVIRAHDAATRRLIGGLRNRLLGEHLDTGVDAIASRHERTGSLIETVRALHGRRRSLEPLDGKVDDLADSLLPHQRIVDPERPVSAEEMADLMLPPEERKSTLRQLTPALLTLASLALLAAAWHWTPLNRWLDAAGLEVLLSRISDSPAVWVAVPAAYVAAGLLSVPLTLLVVVTALVFGPWSGFFIALGGALLSAVCNFALGRRLAGGVVRRVAGARLNRLSERLARRGVLAIVTLRLVPIAPFGLVNLVAGATRVRLRDFVVGSLIGLSPGLLGIALFSHQVATTVRKPELGAFALLAAVAAVLAVGAWMLHRWVQQRLHDSPGSRSA